ncbi:MAG: PQQ-binding-like beta-propeller repeat protein [Planctomycetota bacterium]
MRKRTWLVALGVSAAIWTSSALGTAQDSANWAAWRGPNGNGSAAADCQPPLKWSGTENIKWKTEIPGRGHSTPVLWGDKLFLLTAIPKGGAAAAGEAGAPPRGERPDGPPPPPPAGGRGPGGGRGGRGGGGPPATEYTFAVLCVDAGSGAIKWQKEINTQKPHEGHHPTNTFASCSAVTDGQHVFASFGSFGIACLTVDGELVWKKDLGDMRTRNSFGEGASPALWGDTLMVPWDHEGDSALYALDAKTGDVKWKVDREEPTIWATPLITEFKGRVQVITSGMNRVRSYDLKDGKLIWECEALGTNPIPTPMRLGDTVIVASGYRSYHLVAIPLDGEGNVTERVVWKRNDTAPYVSTPVMYEETLYVTKSQDPLLTIVNAKTGETLMEPQRLPSLNNLYASPLAANGRISFSSRNGTTVVLKHGNEAEVLATNELGEGLDASPIAVGKRLYLRGEKHLFCVEE